MKTIRINPNFRATEAEIQAYIESVIEVVQAMPVELTPTNGSWLSTILLTTTSEAFSRGMEETQVVPIRDTPNGKVSGFIIRGIMMVDGLSPEEIPLELATVMVPEFTSIS